MANKIPLAVADFETQLSTSLAAGGTEFSIANATDDDGNALTAGMYCFTVDNGKTTKEYLLGQLNGTDITSVVRVSRKGVETSGAGFPHRVGAPVVITDFATIQRVADVLRGQVALDNANPIIYDSEPNLTDRKELATVGYVLDNVNGGTLAFDRQTLAGTAGETFSAGDLIWFNTTDQEWYLCDADTAATVEGVQLGIALGAGSDGVGISGGVHISGLYDDASGLTAGDTYYVGNTAGSYTNSAGTTKRAIGWAISATELFFVGGNEHTPSTRQMDAMAGGGTLGTPSGANPFITAERFNSPDVQTFTTTGTWTKPSYGSVVLVELWGAGGGGGGGGGSSSYTGGTGGGGGAYAQKLFNIDDLGATETVTIGTGGSGGAVGGYGTAGGNTTFGSHLTAMVGVVVLRRIHLLGSPLQEVEEEGWLVLEATPRFQAQTTTIVTVEHRALARLNTTLVVTCTHPAQ